MRNDLLRIPPSPSVMQKLYTQFLASTLHHKIAFGDYLESLGYSDPSISRRGMDDGLQLKSSPSGPQLFDIPQFKIQGRLHLIVLLVDFPDRRGFRPKAEYDDLLFSTQPTTASLANYFAETSEHKVQVEGTVHGWFRLPHPYSYYVNNESGMGNNNSTSYPRNAQAMAEDAAKKALEMGVPFSTDLDKLGHGTVTAFLVVHAGPGAEVMQPPLNKSYIWSHKWYVVNPIPVAPGLEVVTYLTIPENCKVGVCAHELGHLAFQWDDFYDVNKDDDLQYWDGSGNWDLMASGSYNGNEERPAHPAGLHKAQHDWVQVEDIAQTPEPQQLKIPPFGRPDAKVVKIRSPGFSPTQYLILENRQQQGFDSTLPGNGLLVWRVDEDRLNVTPAAGLFLIEADEMNELGNPYDGNQGDGGDPFPGAVGRSDLNDTGLTSTSFPGQQPSGIRLSGITQLADGSISVTVYVKPTAN